MKFSLAQIFLSAALLCAATVAVADTLAPNTAIVGPVGTTAAAEPQLAGRVVEDVTTPFSYTGWFEDASSGRPAVNGEVTGSVRSRVVLGKDGTYDFYWRVTVAGNSFLPVAALNLSGLAPATYNANWRSDDRGSVQPAVIMEQASGEVNWRFGQYIPPSTEVYPGQKSYFSSSTPTPASTRALPSSRCSASATAAAASASNGAARVACIRPSRLRRCPSRRAGTGHLRQLPTPTSTAIPSSRVCRAGSGAASSPRSPSSRRVSRPTVRKAAPTTKAPSARPSRRIPAFASSEFAAG